MTYKNTFWGAVASLILGLLLFLGSLIAINQVAAQSAVPCYNEPGAAKRVAASGCEYEFQSGSILDIQSGTTFSNAAEMVQSGVLTVNNNLVVTGTSDLQGNVFDSGGDLTLADNVDVTGTLQYGNDDNFPLGMASSGQEVACSIETVIGSLQVTPTGLSTVTFALVSLSSDPGTDADTGDGEASLVTVDPPSTQTVLIETWAYSGTTATAAATVTLCAFGNE